MKFLLILTIVSYALGHNIQRLRFVGRIVGGISASAEQFPYQISLRYHGEDVCGGSIINQKTILTAAHCVYSMNTLGISVYAGSNQLSEGGVTVQASECTMHEDFHVGLYRNDIAIVALVSPLQYTSTIQPIQVDPNNIGTGVECVLSGWGLLSYPGGNYPDTLQYFDLNVFDFAECKAKFDGGRYPVLNSNICAMSKAGQGACSGDSGGPLVANEKQIGLVSWGSPCGRGSPDVYTRVSSYYNWIQSHLH